MNPDNTNENEKDDSGNLSSISSDLIRGHINTIILRTLYDGDRYGYEIISEIEEKSKGQYTLKQPTLYSALKRLESQDFLTSYWGGVSNGGRRKYFQITDKGRQIVEQNLAEWEYSRTVIDSLISERDYDFNNPPPSHSVDFNILKKSTTRVPTGKADGEDFSDFEENEVADKSVDDTAVSDYATEKSASPTASEVAADDALAECDTNEHPAAAQVIHDEETFSLNGKETGGRGFTQIAHEGESNISSVQKNISDADKEHSAYAETTAAESSRVIPVSPIAQQQEPPLTEEEKQRIHQNYQSLIGDETDATSYYYTHVAQRNREERNSFDNSVFGQTPQDVYTMPQPPVQPQQQPPQENYPPQHEYVQNEVYPQNIPTQTVSAPQQDIAAENESSDLLYANRSPAERNYKSLLSRLYDNTVKTHDEEEIFDNSTTQEQPTYEPADQTQEIKNTTTEPSPQPRTEPPHGNTASNIEFYDVEEKAENEGLRITTTNGARNRTVSKTAGNTFDKGKALFVTAVYIFIIALAESIINICLQDIMHSHTAYVVIPFVIDFAMLGIFLFLYLRGYGKNSRKTQSKSFISASLIIFINLVLITCLIAYLISAATDTPLNFMIYTIFPCVYIFNIPLFAILYNYNTNKN